MYKVTPFYQGMLISILGQLKFAHDKFTTIHKITPLSYRSREQFRKTKNVGKHGTLGMKLSLLCWTISFYLDDILHGRGGGSRDSGISKDWDSLSYQLSLRLGNSYSPIYTVHCTVAIVENWFKNCTLFTVYSTLSTVHCIEYSTTMSTVQ